MAQLPERLPMLRPGVANSGQDQNRSVSLHAEPSLAGCAKLLWHNRSTLPQDRSKVQISSPPRTFGAPRRASPAGKGRRRKSNGGVLRGYVEDFNEPRTNGWRTVSASC
jgi:hypothetical protein